MKKLKRIFIISLIVFSIVNLLSVKIPLLRKELLYQNIPKYYTGDLFELNKVINFKNKIYKVAEKKEEHTLEDCEVITMGDSFFTANFDSAILPDLLEADYNYKVFNVPRDELSKVSDNPLEYLEKIGYKKGSKKYILVESVEKYSIERSIVYVEPFNNTENSSVKNDMVTTIRSFLPKDKINVFFHNSVVMEPLNELGNSFKFNLLKEIDPKTPVYAKDQSQVFYDEDLGFAKRIKSEEDVKIVANNITILRDKLKDLYNLELVYMIIPDKYSVYGYKTEAPIPYEDYIPKVSNEMLKRNIRTFDLYSQYKAVREDQLLYYKGDSHFTPAAKKIALENVVNAIR